MEASFNIHLLRSRTSSCASLSLLEVINSLARHFRPQGKGSARVPWNGEGIRWQDPGMVWSLGTNVNRSSGGTSHFMPAAASVSGGI